MRALKIIAVVGMFFLSCKREKKTEFKILPPEWKDGETTTYAVIVKGDTIGKSIYEINHVKEGYKIDVFTEVESGGKRTSDHSVVAVEKNTLKPLKEEREIKTSGGVYSVDADYTRKSVKIKLKTPMGEKSTEIPLSGNFFDNEVITMLLRNIPFEEGFTAKITSVVPLSATSVPIEINVLGKQKINVPAGKFASRKINLKFAGREVNIWYNEKSPREMLKYEDKQGSILMVLLSKKTSGNREKDKES